jgi:hypothetical protein
VRTLTDTTRPDASYLFASIVFIVTQSPWVFWSFRGGLDDDARNAFRQLAEAAGDVPLQTA